MRLVARAVLWTFWVAVGACGASDTPVAPPTDANVVGAYNLTVVNGGQLPFPYSATATSRFDIISGRMTLTADHKFTDELTTRETVFAGGNPPDLTDTRNGTWQLNSNALTLTYTGLGVQGAVVTGNLITVNDHGLSLTYSK